jgi:DNA-directed RNA polymerase subunit M/transcription elongation factor TFIIS
MYRIQNPETFRSNVRENLSKKINKEAIVKNLERAIFNYAIQEASRRKIIKKWENPYFSQIYVDRLRTIFRNLSPDVINSISTGELYPQTLAFMTHQEMNPGHWETMIQQKKKRDDSKFDTKVEASTDMYTCKKCKSKRCTYYEMQTRSADEAATIFVTCLDCGKHFRG